MSGVPDDTSSIQPAGVLEGRVLAAVQQLCFPDDRWEADFVETLLGQPGSFGLLAVDEAGAPVGCALARVVGEDAEILTIGVLPQARRSGLGRRLVRAVCGEAERRGATALFLEVAEDNDAARMLYAQSGFAQVGRRPAYYIRREGRVAALVLRRSFPN
ncbi:GNAT family N-acetyltransferase [Azospirillum sp.]|uniref:GNAT family N-acetyltransferase n=1 Tax=Azospirillum sp. TaxID=34012 RepID=UPI003D72CE07